jgi:hypothetical protein
MRSTSPDTCKAQKEGRMTVVELMCTRELGDPFRRDALELPKRLLEKYKAYRKQRCLAIIFHPERSRVQS